MCRLGGEKPPRLLKYSMWGLRLNVCTGKSMVAVDTLPMAKRAERGEQGSCPSPYRSHHVSQQINPDLHFTFTLYFYTLELRCRLPMTWSVHGRIRVVCERLQGWMRSDGMWLGMMGLLMVEERSSSRMCHKVFALSLGGAFAQWCYGSGWKMTCGTARQYAHMQTCKQLTLAGHFETSSVHEKTSHKYSAILIQSDVKYTQTL